jgi:hypothetical protein
MKRAQTLYEAASYALNKFRERRLADRRFMPEKNKGKSLVPFNMTDRDIRFAIPLPTIH